MLVPTRPVSVPCTKYPQFDQEIGVPNTADEGPGFRCRVRCIDTGGSGPTVLYLHGHGSRIEEGEALFDQLVSLGVRILSLDLPPFGYSDKIAAPGGTYTVAMLLSIVRAFMEARHIRGAVVVGGSLGGNLALRLAQMHPTWVSEVVVWAPACAWEPQEWLQSALGSWLTALRASGWDGFVESVNRIKDKWYSTDHFREQDPDTDVEWSAHDRQRAIDDIIPERQEVWSPEYREAYWDIAIEQLQDTLYPIAPAISKPALILAAQLDNGAPEFLYDGTRKLDGYLRDAFPDRPREWLREIRTGHSVHKEAPRKLAGLIHEFMRRDGDSDPALRHGRG
jgi:pimeloyl-ACP methyl ester carboxylesterase